MSIINLLPGDYTRRRNQYRANLACFGLFAIVILGVLCGVAASSHRLSTTKTVLDQMNADYLEATKKFEQMQELQLKKAELTRKAEVTASLLERIPRSTVMAVVTNARPEGTCLDEVNLVTTPIITAAPNSKIKAKSDKFAAKKAGNPPPKLITQGVKMTVSGWARTDIQVGRFISSLDQSPLTKSVQLVFSEQVEIGDVVVRKFQIDIDLDNKADAIDVAEAVLPTKQNQPQGKNNLSSMFKGILGVGP